MKFPSIISMKLENFLDFHEFLGVRQANRKKQDETGHPVYRHQQENANSRKTLAAPFHTVTNFRKVSNSKKNQIFEFGKIVLWV